ncbi:hypothetical protein ACI2IP_13885 [Microbacterium sp. NPDC090218]
MLLAGCSPEPEPTPTPTPAFASEEEAFAAAEETYRAYAEALNQVDFALPATFEPVYALLSGAAADSTKKAFSEFHAKRIRTAGVTTYDTVTRVSADLVGGVIHVNVCTDVSEVVVVDASGASIVSEERPPRQSMMVTFKVRGGDDELTISDLEASEDLFCAR